tara:strand:- start:148 stop:378 length:231 start_codon:yes stop_codon:yes gene_type:complete
MKKGEIVKWHNTSSTRRKIGVILQVVQSDRKDCVKVMWQDGRVEKVAAWQLFYPDGKAIFARIEAMVTMVNKTRAK